MRSNLEWIRVVSPTINRHQGRIQDFKLGGGALKKIAPSGGRHEHFWGISCEKSRFYAKKSYFFPILGGACPPPPWIRPWLLYYIIDEIFFDNFLEIIYLLVVCKKNNNSFILVYFKYLFISCTYKKNNNSFILVYFCQRSQVKFSCKIYKNNTQEQ